MWKTGVSKAEYLVQCTNVLCMVSSPLVWLVFDGSMVQKLFCNLFMLLFFVIGIVREKRGRRRGRGKDPCSMKYDIELNKTSLI